MKKENRLKANGGTELRFTLDDESRDMLNHCIDFSSQVQFPTYEECRSKRNFQEWLTKSLASQEDHED